MAWARPRPPATHPTGFLDASLRGYLETNADIVTRIDKPVPLDDIGALSAQSDQPILFENIVEKPGFRLCDILVKNRRSQARALGVDARRLSEDARLPPAPAAARLQARQDRTGEGGGQAPQRGRLDASCRSRCTRTRMTAPYVTAMNIIRDPETGFYNSCHAGTHAVGPRRGLDQLRDAALARDHEQVSQARHEQDADRLRVRPAAGLRDHGQFLRPAHGHVGRDGDGRHHHGPRHRDGAVRDSSISRCRRRPRSWSKAASTDEQVQGRRRDLALHVPPAALREPAGGRDHRDHHARGPADLPQPPDLPGHRPPAAAAALP